LRLCVTQQTPLFGWVSFLNPTYTFLFFSQNLRSIAIAWTLNNPAVTAAIVGARNPKQVEGIIAAGEFRLNQQELDKIGTFLRENP
jgi:Aldo/keto reductase family